MRGHSAEVLFMHTEQELATAGRRTGVHVYDLRSGRAVQAAEAGYQSARITRLVLDEWRVVAAVQWLDRLRWGDSMHRVAVTDRRMTKQLWYIRDSLPIRHLHFDDGLLAYSSAAPNNPVSLWQEAHRQPYHGGSVQLLDFSAPLSELADAACPYSSLYEDLYGRNHQLALETPYDDVNPDRFG
jgi:hypothetical protein